MTVRDAYLIDDIQRCVHKMLATLATDPWTRWDVILGWPEADAITGKFPKPPIYVMPPKIVDWKWSQGSRPDKIMRMIIGAWDDRGSGGTEEINIIGSNILNLFTDPKTVHTSIFTIKLGSTTYTNTTLIAQGVRVLSIVGPRQISPDDLKEFRIEFDLDLII